MSGMKGNQEETKRSTGLAAERKQTIHPPHTKLPEIKGKREEEQITNQYQSRI